MYSNNPVRHRAQQQRNGGLSDYTRDTERKVERLLAELYELLRIHKPEDLYGSIVIETRYQKGRPVGQVDVNIKYVMKRTSDPDSSL